MGLRRHDTLLLTMGPNTLTLMLERLAGLSLALAKGEPTEKHVALVEDVLNTLNGIRQQEDTPADVEAKELDMEVATRPTDEAIASAQSKRG